MFFIFEPFALLVRKEAMRVHETYCDVAGSEAMPEAISNVVPDAILADFDAAPAKPGSLSAKPRLCARREVEQGLEAMLDRLWRFALMRCGDQATADDLVQAACLRALERAEQFEPGSRLDSWLYTILESIWRNMTRAQSVRRGNGITDVADAHLESADPDEDTRIAVADTMRHIAELPAGQRTVLLLTSIEGLSYAETARVLDLPSGTIMSRLAAARTKLRTLRDAKA